MAAMRGEARSLPKDMLQTRRIEARRFGRWRSSNRAPQACSIRCRIRVRRFEIPVEIGRANHFLPGRHAWPPPTRLLPNSRRRRTGANAAYARRANRAWESRRCCVKLPRVAFGSGSARRAQSRSLRYCWDEFHCRRALHAGRQESAPEANNSSGDAGAEQRMAIPDVEIRGAGIFGLAVACACAKRGAAVRVVEKRCVAAGASGGPVGSLSPHSPDNWNPKKQFQLESLAMAKAWWGELEVMSGVNPGFSRKGRIQPVATERGLELSRKRAEHAKKELEAIGGLERCAGRRGRKLELISSYRMGGA